MAELPVIAEAMNLVMEIRPFPMRAAHLIETRCLYHW